MTDVTTCHACGADGDKLVELPDGTLYCPIHRGPAQAVTVVPPPIEPVSTHAVQHTEPHGAIVTDGPVDPRMGAALNTGDPTEPPTTEAVAHSTADELTDTERAGLKLVIGLTIMAGLRSLDEDDNPLEPPLGWMPPPAANVLVIEGGAALAVASLIREAGLPHDAVRALAQQFLDTDTETEQAE